VFTTTLKEKQLMTTQELDQMKNALLCYLLEAVEGNFHYLTEDERGIVGNQETFDVLLQSINSEGGE
tara:strand:+ start:2190 stop:2390 length:201 start_codon:yes stop_codon:yes gene_type:complete